MIFPLYLCASAIGWSVITAISFLAYDRFPEAFGDTDETFILTTLLNGLLIAVGSTAHFLLAS